jgi:hypothetical protein
MPKVSPTGFHCASEICIEKAQSYQASDFDADISNFAHGSLRDERPTFTDRCVTGDDAPIAFGVE